MLILKKTQDKKRKHSFSLLLEPLMGFGYNKIASNIRRGELYGLYKESS